LFVSCGFHRSGALLLSGDGTWDHVLAALLVEADAAGLVDWAVSIDSTIIRAHQHAATLKRDTGGRWNYKNLLAEPADHALGRSRGGLSTKIHQLVDGHGRPLVVLTGPGQAGDAPMFPHLMAHLSIARPGMGRPRTRPERVRADKAYSSRAVRSFRTKNNAKQLIWLVVVAGGARAASGISARRRGAGGRGERRGRGRG
jgi:hypothetical protein